MLPADHTTVHITIAAAADSTVTTTTTANQISIDIGAPLLKKKSGLFHTSGSSAKGTIGSLGEKVKQGFLNLLSKKMRSIGTTDGVVVGERDEGFGQTELFGFEDYEGECDTSVCCFL